MACFPRVERHFHLGLALARFFGDPHGAVEQAASATLLQHVLLAERLVDWMSWRKFNFGNRMKVGWEIASVDTGQCHPE
jgi:hypothetical protein